MGMNHLIDKKGLMLRKKDALENWGIQCAPFKGIIAELFGAESFHYLEVI